MYFFNALLELFVGYYNKKQYFCLKLVKVVVLDFIPYANISLRL